MTNQFCVFIRAVAILAGACFLAAGQSAGDMDSAVSPSLIGGNPPGSRAQSSIENVNLYNGNLNVTIPLYGVGGRGSAGYSIVVPIQRRWNVTGTTSLPSPYSWLDAFSQLDYGATPYSPGTVVIRRSSGTAGQCSELVNGQYKSADFGPYLTRLVWVTPDGTETVLRDVQYDGQPQPTQNPPGSCQAAYSYSPVSRGTLFASADASDITFIADQAISDSVDSLDNDGQFQSGWLYFRDGTKYRIDGSGRVSSIQDRNGNTTSVTYDDYDDVTITDALGRTITADVDVAAQGANSCSNNGGDLEPFTDNLTYPGYQSTPRSIKVNHNCLSAALPAGQSVQNYTQLFPELSGADSTQFNPDVITSVVLPNGSSYSFQYNAYGELTQLTLPTGGVYKYYYQQSYSCPSGSGGAATDGVISISDYAGKSIYRRLTERDEYSDGVNVSGKTTYEACAEAHPDPNHSSRSETTVLVDHYSFNGSLLRHENHYFYGDPSSASSIPAATNYPNWSDGLEFRTDIGDSASAIRQTQQSVWGQRPCGTSVNTGNAEPCWFSNPQSDSVPSHDPQLCQSSTNLDGNSPSGQVRLYDSYNNVTDLYEFDYGAAPAVAASCPTSASGFTRHTNTAFNYGTNYVAQGTHIWNLPSSITLLDSQGNQAAQRQFSYDAGGLQPESGISQLNTPAGPRGNVTSDLSWWNVNNSLVGHQYAYDVAGNVSTDKDANGNVTSLGYSDPNNSYAHVTAVTLAQGQQIAESMTMQYDYSTGAITQFTDVNGAPTQYSYANDPLDRLTQITRPDNGATTFSYPSLTWTIEKDDRTNANDQVLETDVIYDDLLRPIQTWKKEASNNSVTYQFYDALGRVDAIANPIATTNSVGTSSSCSSLQCTSLAYDSLNRLTASTTPDGLSATVAYWTNTVTVTDQANNARQYKSDGLGRLTQVIENSNSMSVQDSSMSQPVTTYCYSVLDELTTVYQPIGTTCDNNSYAYQMRSFSYDSLGQLSFSTQPEYQNGGGSPGSISFFYDSNGNSIGKQDSRGERTCYAYDGLNRLTMLVYYEGQFNSQCAQIPGSSYDPYTTAVSFTYGTSGNETGLLTKVSNGNSITTYSSFDALGRPQASSQITAGQTYNFRYSYNLTGALATETYPSGRTVTTTYDNGNLPSQVQGIISGQQAVNYLSSITYYPQEAPNSYTYGNQLARAYTYNSRLQTQSTSDIGAQGTLLSLSYTWDQGTPTTHNNGSLRGQTIATPPGTFNQTFSYDPLNRLQSLTDSAAGTTLQRNFNYDPYSNPWVSRNDSGLPSNVWTPTSNQYNGSNQIPSVNPSIPNYDGAGNRIVLGAYTLQYDVENQLLWAWQQSAPSGYIAFSYDGAGQRIQKQSSSGAITTYVYDAFGRLADEYSNDAPTPCTTCYFSWDQLGSTRLVTDQGGGVVSWHDFLAFGDEVPGSSMGRSASWDASSDTTTQRFTGQIRDDGPGLDYFEARYYSSALGQFMSPDPLNAGADLFNPRSWNGYAYVMNNPLSDIDPDGLQSCTSPCASTSPGSASSQNAGTPSAGFSGFGFDISGSISKPPLFQQSKQTIVPQPVYASSALFVANTFGVGYIPTESTPFEGGLTSSPQQPPKNVIKVGNFKTLDCDGYRAARSILPQTTKQGIEFGGFLYKNPNGNYSYSNPVSGTPTSIPSLFSSPQAFVSGIAGWFHSHPLVPGYTNNNFSGNDLLITRYLKGPGYLATADGTILKLSIDPKGYPQISSVNSGACQVP